MNDVQITVRYGVKELVDRQMITLRTGDESADMIIADLERRLNKSADRIEELLRDKEAR